MAGLTGRRDTTDAAPHSDSHMTGPSGGKAEGDDLSPEDAAWVDSCLVKDDHPDPDGRDRQGNYLSDDAWAALTEAFAAALAYSASGTATSILYQGKVVDEHEPLSSVHSGLEALRANASGDDLVDADDQGLTFQTEPLIAEPSSPTASAYAATFYDQPSPTPYDSSGDGPLPTVADLFQGAAQGGSSNERLAAATVVLGSEYPEAEGYGGDGEDEFSVAEGGEEVGEAELTRDVFKVWELDVPDADEEEEFGWQLKKALEAGRGVGAVGRPPPLADEDPSTMRILEEWKMQDKPSAPALDDQNLQKLIASISDMSLGRSRSSEF